MDSFKIIQNFFTKMSCQYCMNHFRADDIELIREEQGVHVVSVSCFHCQKQIGVAMVGLEMHADMAESRHFPDPELTEAELERLSSYDVITDDDVLNAHHFFQNLGDNWAQYLPKTSVQTDTAVAQNADEPFIALKSIATEVE